MSPVLIVIILAVVQGITEFLPISSSGHLVLTKALFGLETPGVVLEVGLHFGTLISILIYYRKRIGTLIVETIKGTGEGRRLPESP